MKRRAARRASSARFRFAGREFLVLRLDGDGRALLDAVPPAERDVALRVLDGESNAEIARARGTSPGTVAKQLAALYRRLRVGSRADLVGLLSRAPARPKS
ncbi:MAG TPA: helix-turn-helix transcriptional regulator [Polyangia bacterium]|nr:helix-turn-helix transcriptional regulator [Polyangia bacterium]